MGKYLVLWEIVESKVPINRKDIAMGWAVLASMVKEDFKKGLTKDWGAFTGEDKGYAILEGNPLDVAKALNQYAPFVEFNVKEVLKIDDVQEIIKSMSK
jgi:hypothetical protein